MGPGRNSGCICWLGGQGSLHLPESSPLFCQVRTTRPHHKAYGVSPSVPTYVHLHLLPGMLLQLSFPTNPFCLKTLARSLPDSPPLGSHPCAFLDTDVHLRASSVSGGSSASPSRVLKSMDHLTFLSAPGTWEGGSIKECWLINS